MRIEQLRLYLVTDRSFLAGRDMVSVVREAVAGGVTMLQLREKHLDTRAFVQEAIALKKALAGTGVPLVINDRLDVALASGADGVHIGQSDMPYLIARKLLGPDAIIGLSVENMDQVRQAETLDVDYIGVSPVFSTLTKEDTAAPFGLEGLQQAAEISSHPIVAIGGMKLTNVSDVIKHGADGIALVSAIMGSNDPRKASQQLIKVINETLR